MKKTLAIILSFALIISLALPAFATEVSDECVIYKEITFEEAIAKKMACDNISYTQARNELLEEEQRILTELGLTGQTTRNSTPRSDIINYYNFEKTFSYPQNSSFSCAINATLVIVSDYYNSRYIDSVATISTRRVSGLYSYDWNQTGVWSNISYDKKSVDLGATGYFSVTTTTSSGASIDIPGFSVSGSVGSIHTYLSETMSLQTTYYVY